MSDPFQVLGISPGASIADIKKAFRDKAKNCHPDVAGSSSGDTFKRLAAAYQEAQDLQGLYDGIWLAQDDYDFLTKPHCQSSGKGELKAEV